MVTTVMNALILMKVPFFFIKFFSYIKIAEYIDDDDNDLKA